MYFFWGAFRLERWSNSIQKVFSFSDLLPKMIRILKSVYLVESTSEDRWRLICVAAHSNEYVIRKIKKVSLTLVGML